MHFGISKKCIDYTGVHILKYPHQQVLLYTNCMMGYLFTWFCKIFQSKEKLMLKDFAKDSHSREQSLTNYTLPKFSVAYNTLIHMVLFAPVEDW